MMRANVVLQELRENAEGKCCSARAEGECRANVVLQELRVNARQMLFYKSSGKMLRANAVLQELRANAEGEFCSARAEGEC